MSRPASPTTAAARFGPARLSLLGGLLLAVSLAACRGGPSLPAGVGGTAQVLAATAQAGGEQALTAVAAQATAAAPTVQAAGTQVAGAAATAATAVANFTPPATLDQSEAEAAIRQFAQDVLGISVTVERAGGLSADIDRLIELPEGGEQAQAAGASGAAQTYAAVLEGGAASLSYGAGRLTGDLTIDLHSASLGAYTFLVAGTAPNADAALSLALEIYPGLAGRGYAPYPVSQGYAWVALGQAPGFDRDTREATLVAEAVLLAVNPGIPRRTVVSAVVGKGDFAADVIP